MDERVVAQAKAYAKEHGISLSGIVENYLKVLTKPRNHSAKKLTRLVKSLSGSLKLRPDFDFEQDRLSHLEERYR